MMFNNDVFIKEEVRDGYKVDLSRKKLWKTELDILAEVQRICEAHNLHYFLIGGAAIGAVRHKGFIPWDDDMDLGMLREDFDEFLRVARQEIKRGYILQYGPQEADLFSPLLRIRDGRTTGITHHDVHSHANQGIFVEIYPFDNVPDSALHRKIQQFSSRMYSNILHANYYPIQLSLVTRIFKMFVGRVSNNRLFEKWTAVSTKYNKKKTKYVDTIMMPNYSMQNIHLFERNLVEKTYKVPYEYMEVELAEGNDKFLRQQYGDYMQLPPLDQRGTHHDNTVFYDPDHPYTYWIDKPELADYFTD